MESLVGASANVLVDIIQGKAGTGKSFEAHRYVLSQNAFINILAIFFLFKSHFTFSCQISYESHTVEL